MEIMNDLTPDQTLIEVVRKHMETADIDLTLTAPIQTSVIKNGAYRTQQLTGAESFTFFGLREGKRSSYIFEFEPVDARDYSRVEFNEQTVFTAFPHLQGELLKALNMPEFQGGFKAAAAKFRTTVRRAQAKAEAEAMKAAEKKAASHYEGDPLWGAF